LDLLHQHILVQEIEIESMSSITLLAAENYLDTLQKFIDDDITVAINGNARMNSEVIMKL